MKVSKFKIVKPVEKVRKMDNGMLSLEVKEENDKKSFILVFKTMRPLYVGNLVFSSRVKRVEEKAHKN